MNPDNINALSTAVLAFVTILGLMVGFYYNLRTSGITLTWIIVWELLFLAIVWFFTSWVKGGMKHAK